MKLPNAHLAVVEHGKIVGYLLNSMHPLGSSKSRFFEAFGFRAEAWEVFANSLREHGQQHDVHLVKETGYGPRFEIDGRLDTPDGRNPMVRSVWQLDEGQEAPRLITAYPIELP